MRMVRIPRNPPALTSTGGGLIAIVREHATYAIAEGPVSTPTRPQGAIEGKRSVCCRPSIITS